MRNVNIPRCWASSLSEIGDLGHFPFSVYQNMLCYICGYGLGDGHIIATELGAAGSLAHYESN